MQETEAVVLDPKLHRFSESPPYSPGSMSRRLELLERLAPDLARLGARTPDTYVLSHEEIPARLELPEILYWIKAKEQELLQATLDIKSDRIFSHAYPLVDSAFPDLSFAGVYPSYAPRRGASRAENLVRGLSSVITAPVTVYSNYYFSRHKIVGRRFVDVAFTGLIEDAEMIGTAFVCGDHCLLGYHDSALSVLLNDPRKIAASRHTGLEGIGGRLFQIMFGIQEVASQPMDIEFAVDRHGRVYIRELRVMSLAHLRNWERVTDRTWRRVEEDSPPSILPNCVGKVEGEVIDLRKRRPNAKDLSRPDEKIYILNHGETAEGTGALEFLQIADARDLRGVSLIVCHAKTTRDDHLQYIVLEDPGVSFVANTTEVPSAWTLSGTTVVSDGFNTKFF